MDGLEAPTACGLVRGVRFLVRLVVPRARLGLFRRRAGVVVGLSRYRGRGRSCCSFLDRVGRIRRGMSSRHVVVVRRVERMG